MSRTGVWQQLETWRHNFHTSSPYVLYDADGEVPAASSLRTLSRDLSLVDREYFFLIVSEYLVIFNYHADTRMKKTKSRFSHGNLEMLH